MYLKNFKTIGLDTMTSSDPGSTPSKHGAHSMSKKREGYIDWNEYFMGIALISAQRSKDPSCQVGACIVNPNKRIVGVGYNGFPDRCICDNDGKFPWDKNDEDQPKKPESETKYPYVCHAEMNAIINRMSSDLTECEIYTTRYPCAECAKLIIQSGIKYITYYDDKKCSETEISSKKMFTAADINEKQYKKNGKKFQICDKECEL